MIVLSLVVAIALVLAQGCAVWAFLRFVKSFGAYTESHQAMTNALLYTHESNCLVHQANLQVLEKLTVLHRSLKSQEAA
jgi:flagellar biogenesis protein FliO